MASGRRGGRRRRRRRRYNGGAGSRSNALGSLLCTLLSSLSVAIELLATDSLLYSISDIRFQLSGTFCLIHQNMLMTRFISVMRSSI